MRYSRNQMDWCKLARIARTDHDDTSTHFLQFFQVTLLQVADLQWDATGAVLGPLASKSALALAPSSRPACGVLTIDTNPPPEFTRGATERSHENVMFVRNLVGSCERADWFCLGMHVHQRARQRSRRQSCVN